MEKQKSEKWKYRLYVCRFLRSETNFCCRNTTPNYCFFLLNQNDHIWMEDSFLSQSDYDNMYKNIFYFLNLIETVHLGPSKDINSHSKNWCRRRDSYSSSPFDLRDSYIKVGPILKYFELFCKKKKTKFLECPKEIGILGIWASVRHPRELQSQKQNSISGRNWILWGSRFTRLLLASRRM